MKSETHFHATTDKQIVRDAVFDLIKTIDVKVYAQILEKSKAQPNIRPTRERFYQYGWYYLFKFIAPRFVTNDTELMVTAASLGTRKERARFTSAIHDVLSQTTRIQRDKWVTAFCPAQADPCLQIADYCVWALQRKWETAGKDVRSYDLIKDKIAHEYNMFQKSGTHYY